jgi:hypothetical protein
MATSQTQDNPDAFPCAAFGLSGETYLQEGMTLRDWFAGQALLGIAGYFTNLDAEEMTEEAAKSATAAYLIADAMLAARAQVSK